jgi:hypothetical protein
MVLRIGVSFFDQIASKFNTDGENKTPIYVGVPVWLKLSINLKYPKGGFQIPLSPNFIERCRKGVEKPTSLALNPKYETIKQELATVGVGGANTSSSNASGTMSNQAAFPNFPGMS